MFCRKFATRFAGLLAAMLVVASAAELLAQRGERVKLQGKVKLTAGDQLVVEDKPDSEVSVITRKGTHTEITGTAVPEYLVPTVAVEFVADVNKAGVVPEPLTEITVCNFTEARQPTFSLADPTKPSRKGKDAVNKYEVRGTIKTNRNGKLTITAAEKTVKATLAPDAKIKVLVSDLSFVQAGDSVSVQGIEPIPGEVHAQTLRVTMSKPLEPKKEEGPKKRTAGR